MKVKFECKVESKTKIEETIIQFGEKIYEFFPNDEGYFSKIRITGTAPNPEKFRTGFSQLPNHKKNSLIYFHIDHDFKDAIVQELQFLEGMFSFAANLRRISWDDVLLEMIPETRTEKKQIKLNLIGFKPTIQDEPCELSQHDISQILMRLYTYSPLSVYLAFFKEGSNDFLSRRFINAFFSFYFILEAIYGNDKWRNYQVRAEFEKSREFVRILRKHIAQLKSTDLDDYKKLVGQVKALRDPKGNPLNLRMGAKGIIYLIVDTRGSLLHFSMDDERQKGSPFKQEDYFALSLILRNLAGETLQLLMDAFDKRFLKGRKKSKN